MSKTIGLKRDMSEAYERKEWNILMETLKALCPLLKNVSPRFHTLLLNGSKFENFVDAKGLTYLYLHIYL